MQETSVSGQVNWNRRVLTLALPIILANIAQPILSMVDTMIAGHLPSPAYLGGVALATVFFNFLFWSFAFLRMATTGLTAQAYGMADLAGLRDHLLRALLVALSLGTLVVMLQTPLTALALGLLGGSDAVQTNALAYASARIWSTPATLANFAILGYLIGCQRVMAALLLQVAVNVVNLAATLVLVFGFDWGVTGIGAGTPIAEWAGLPIGLVLIARGGLPLTARIDWRAIVDRDRLVELFAVNRDIFLRSLMLLTCFGWFARAGAAEGDAVLAANAVLLNFQALMAFALDGFAHAAEALGGAAVGARDRDGLRRVIRASFLWGFAVACAFSLAYALGGVWIIALLTDQEAIRAVAHTFLPYAAMLPMVAVWGFILDGIYIGATCTRQLRNAMAVCTATFLIAAAILQPPLGNHGLWISMYVLMAMRGTTLGLLLGSVFRRADPDINPPVRRSAGA